MSTLQKSAQEVFESPITKGKTVGEKWVGDLYQSTLTLKEYLPSSVSPEHYLEAKRALRAMWNDILDAEKKFDSENNFHLTSNGEFPKRGSFITASFEEWTSERSMSEVHEDVTKLTGLFNVDEKDEDCITVGVGRKQHFEKLPYVSICYVYSTTVYTYRYFRDAEVLKKSWMYEIEDIVKWREDTEEELNKVPCDILERIKNEVARK